MMQARLHASRRWWLRQLGCSGRRHAGLPNSGSPSAYGSHRLPEWDDQRETCCGPGCHMQSLEDPSVPAATSCCKFDLGPMHLAGAAWHDMECQHILQLLLLTICSALEHLGMLRCTKHKSHWHRTSQECADRCDGRRSSSSRRCPQARPQELSN